MERIRAMYKKLLLLYYVNTKTNFVILTAKVYFVRNSLSTTVELN